MADDLRVRADALFAAALARSPAERSGFLAEAGAGDPRLRDAVEELLRLAAEPVPALEPGRAAGALLGELFGGLEDRRRVVAPGDSVGPWRLERELGRGGMGVVYLATRADGLFEQTVALKLLHLGAELDDTLHRFEQERQILAYLEHPNIARLIDGGRTDDGRPYLAMEYVVGRRIDLYCDEERLGLDRRIELFVRVARAVHAAHRRLIVHRDLKPSNILVTDDGSPKLLDFGIAKLLRPAADSAPLTRTLARVLTPEYASPEQVRGEAITTASDVYQLGLLLFELLTGERAQRFGESPTPAAIERAVCDTETPRPSRVAARRAAEPRRLRAAVTARTLRGDLDNIVLRALHKEPDRRYGSAAELVADLEAFRRGYPIEARPDTLWYRTAKFVRRNRIAVSAATLVGLLLLGYAVTATLQQRRILREAERSREATEFVTRMFSKLASGEIGSGEASALEVLDEGSQQARSELTGQPDLQADLLTAFGELYMKVGRYDRAIPHLEHGLSIRSRRLGPGDLRVAETALLLGRNLHYAGRLHDAEAPLRRAREAYLGARGPGHSDSCAALAHLGDLLHSLGDLASAERELQTAVEECGGGLALRDLANVLRDRGDLDRALAAYPVALERLDDERQIGLTLLYWGYALTLAGDLDRAERAFQRTREIDDVEYRGDHPVFAMELRFRGRLALARGELIEAERLTEQSLAMNRRWLGDEHHQVPRLIVDRAGVALARGRPEAALAAATEAQSRYDELGIADHPMAIEARQLAAAALLERGDLERAIAGLRGVVARQQKLFAPEDARLGASHALLAEALDRADLGDPAAEARRAARAVFERAPGSAVLYCRTYGDPVREAAPGVCPL